MTCCRPITWRRNKPDSTMAMCQYEISTWAGTATGDSATGQPKPPHMLPSQPGLIGALKRTWVSGRRATAMPAPPLVVIRPVAE